MRELVVLAIRAYQRFVSPYKGFSCAYRAHTGRCSCSEFGRRAVQRKGVFTGLLLLDARLQRCGATYRFRQRRLHLQRGMIHCDLPDLSGCDCSGADAFNCVGCDACNTYSSCDWRRRPQSEDPYVQIMPSTGKRGRRPDGEASTRR